MAKKKQYLIAVKIGKKKPEIFAFDNLHDRAMFLDAIARTHKKGMTFAFSEK